MAIVFSEPVVGFTIANIGASSVGAPQGTRVVEITDLSQETNLAQEPGVATRYTFVMTPIAPYNLFPVIFSGATFGVPAVTDAAGNALPFIQGSQIIYVASPNAAPVAEAGDPQTVDSGEMVTLEGSGTDSDSDDETLAYSWERTGGTDNLVVTLSDPKVAKPSFTADTLTPGAPDVTHTFTLTVTDDDDASHEDTVTITVTSPFAPVVADAGPDQEVTRGELVTLDGSGSTSDRRYPIGLYSWERTSGTTGGSVTLDDAKVAKPRFIADMLDEGDEDVIHIFTLTVTDSDGDTDTDLVRITVKAPVVEDVTAPGGEFKLSPNTHDGTPFDMAVVFTEPVTGFTASDFRFVKQGGTTTQPSVTNLQEDPNNELRYTFTVSPNDTASFLIILDADRVTDEADNGNLSFNFSINYQAPPPAPRVAAAGDDQMVAAGATVTLDGSGSTVVNGPISAYNWTRESGTSTRTTVFATDGGGTTKQREISTPTTTFVADNVPSGGTAVTHVIALRVLDADGIPSPKDLVTIMVNPNQLPTADAGEPQSVTSGTKVDLDGSKSSDPDGTIASYSWERTSGDATATLTGANTASPSFTAEVLDAGAPDATHVFELTVTDNNGETDTATVTVTVISDFATPDAIIAGGNRELASGATVQLDGSGSTFDSRRTPLTYSWARTGGTSTATGTLTDAMTAKPSFTAETLDAGAEDVTHILTLTVTDSEGGSDTATVTITVEAPDAVADTTAPTGTFETAPTTHDGMTPNNLAVVFSEPVTGFTESGLGGIGLFLVYPPAGTAQDDVRPMLSNVMQDSTNELRYTFTVTPIAPYDIWVRIQRNRLTDEAGNQNGQIDGPYIGYVASPNAAPVAEAGDPQTVDSGELVTLEGSGTDSDSGDETLAYSWERTGGTDNLMVTLSDAKVAKPTFTADTLTPGAADVTHTFTLTVTDDDDASHEDTVTITVIAPFAPTVADAGADQEVASGALVELDGSGSTSDRRFPIGEYEWKWTSGTGGAIAPDLTNADMEMATFTADTLTAGAADVTHTFTLTVTDEDGDKDDDTVTITVKAPNADPVAEAGAPQRRVTGGTVTLDGSGSMDPDALAGEMLKYSWLRATGAGEGSGDPVTLSNRAIAGPTFTAETPDAGAADDTYGFTLTVTDADEATDKDTVTITVNAPPKAEAGPDRTYGSAASVTLDGSGSSDTTGTFTYAWLRTEGADSGDAAAVTLVGANTANPTFTAETLASGAPNVSYGFTLTVTDADGIEATDTVKITVTSGNLPPVAEAGNSATWNSGVTVTLTGSGTDTDSDDATLTYAWTRADGTTTGLTKADEAIASFTADILAPGADDVEHTFTLTVTDDDDVESEPDTVTITVNAPPKAVVKNAERTVASGASVTLDGSGSSDSTGMLTYAWTRPGVDLTGETASMLTFTAPTRNPGDGSVTYIYTLTVTDEGATNGDVLTNDAVVRITVEAPPYPALVARAGPDQDNVPSGTKGVQLDGSGSTVSSGGRTVSYAWTREMGTAGGTGSPVTLTDDDTLEPTFDAPTLNPGAEDATYIFTLTVTDDQGSTIDIDTVMITVKAPAANEDPVAEAGEPQTVDSGATVQLEGSGTDMGGTIASWLWTRTGGTAGGMVAFSDATIARPTFTADTLAEGADDVTHILTLTVTDNDGASHADMVTITVEAPNADPVAEAGEPQTVDSGATVQLEGSATDMGGTIASWLWTRSGGTQGGVVTFSDATIARPTFTADTLAEGADDVRHILTLTVTDNDGATHADMVTITVEAPAANEDPVAEAGEPQTVDSGATVQLEGSGTDMGGTIASWLWTRTGGTMGGMVAFSDATIARPTFTADTLAAGADDVRHILTLTVTDNDGATHADTVTITVEAPNADPVAEAGDPQTVDSGATVQLEGSGTDMGGTIASWLWTRTGGTMGGMVAFSDATIARPTFTADTLAAGADDVRHILTLTVTDNDGATHADTVTITVEAPNADPVAEAGDPQTVDSGATVQLEGSGTDMGGTIASWLWTRSSGTAGGMVALSDATIARPTFTADTLAAGAADVTHILTLTVTDNDGATHADMVTITVEAPNADPVAEAGEPQTVDSGATVQLEGSGTDMGGSIASWLWTRTGGTMGGMVAFSDATIARPTFTADTLAAGADDVTHILTLTVTDNDGATHADTVTITVVSPTVALVANAGMPTTVASGTTSVTLDGNGSRGDDRAELSYAWDRTGGTGDASTVTLTGKDTATPSFTAETLADLAASVTHIFTLTVTDDRGSTAAKDAVTITVIADLVADAGTDQTVGSGATVPLDGRLSTVSDSGRDVTYAWARTSGTGDSSLVPSDPAARETSFTAETLTAGDPAVRH